MRRRKSNERHAQSDGPRRENKIINWAALSSRRDKKSERVSEWALVSPAQPFLAGSPAFVGPERERVSRAGRNEVEVPERRKTTGSRPGGRKVLEWCSNKSHWKIARPRACREVSSSLPRPDFSLSIFFSFHRIAEMVRGPESNSPDDDAL